MKYPVPRASREEEIEIHDERNNKQDHDQIGSESISFFLSSRSLSLNASLTRGSTFLFCSSSLRANLRSRKHGDNHRIMAPHLRSQMADVLLELRLLIRWSEVEGGK